MSIFYETAISTSLMFMPHGMCYLWKPGLVGLHLVSDASIALAYFSIPLTLIQIVRQRRDLPFNWLFFLFAAFIVSCGSGHLFNIWTLWHPNYWISGYIDALTALVSVATAIALTKLVPQIMTMPSVRQITGLNEQLQQKVEELEQTQAAIREKEQFLQTLLNNVSDGIAACDREGKITQFNPACKKLFGLPQKSLPSEQWSEHYRIYSPDGKTLLKEEDIPLVRAFKGESVRNAEIVTVLKSGDSHYLSINGDPLVDAEGKNIGAVVVMHDISERKRAANAARKLNEELEIRVQQRTEELEASNMALKTENIERQKAETSLRASMATNRAILNAIPDLIFCIDRQGIFSSFNAANADDFCLISTSEFTRKSINEVFPVELASPIIDSVATTFSTKKLQVLECQLSTQDRVRSYEVRSVVCQDNQVMAIVRNITERKQAEEEIRQAIEQEKKLSELKSRFVTMASHEFRTPLTSIMSSSELLEHYGSKWNEAKKLTHLHRIQSSVKHMTSLLNDVLLLGKVEAGKLQLQPTQIDLSEFCQELVEEIQLTSQTHQIIFQVECSLEFTVCMDEKLLRHIINNLISNAIKYSPEGDRVIFELICQSEEATFRVQDFGIGIPIEEQDRLFDSFHRGANVGSIPGTGLGLPIVKRAVDLHGGTILVESKVGVGTIFTVVLPDLAPK
jgi:PAS domain S-box-containing protein